MLQIVTNDSEVSEVFTYVKIYDFNKKYIWEILLDNEFQLHFILNRLINRLKLKKIEI